MSEREKLAIAPLFSRELARLCCGTSGFPASFYHFATPHPRRAASSVAAQETELARSDRSCRERGRKTHTAQQLEGGNKECVVRGDC